MNENRTALGSWPNAPLALVLAQVKFSPTPDIGSDLVLERFKKAIGSEFPVSRKLQQVKLVFGPVGSPDAQMPQQPQTSIVGHDLRTSANDEVILIHDDAFTFMTAAYVDSAHFAMRWKSFMNTLFDGNELQVNRLGLRYVDFIIPSEGHVPEDYLREIGRSPSALGEQSQFTSLFFDYPRKDGGSLRVQYFRGEGDPELPADLQGGVAVPACRPQRKTDGASGVLDMDRWRPNNNSMSAETASDALISLREDIAESFRSIMTELAYQEWAETTAKG